jgi:hypothetical protein
MYSRSRKPDGDSGRVGDSSIVASLSSLLETISGLSNADRSQALISSFWPDYLEEFTGIYDNIIVYIIIIILIL